MTTFSHRDETTAEEAWVRAGASALLPLPDDALPDSGTIVVLAAHPDDEALGATALLARARGWGVPVTVLLFTAGDRSHPNSRTHTREQLKDIRLDEFHAALSELNGSVSARVLDLPDGGLSEHGDWILDEIMTEIAEADGPVTIVAPYSGDGHCDHEALGIAALEAGRRRRALVLEYPIWYWHWASPQDARWRRWRFLSDPDDVDRHAVIGWYRSQILPLSDLPGDEVILSPAQIEHHDRGGDTYAVTDFRSPDQCHEPARSSTHDAATASTVFDGVHADSADPWSVRSSDYEIAKRDDLLARLPQKHYSHIVEIGCSIGVLSRELAQRADRVTAIDASRQALRSAERLSAPDSKVLSYFHGTVPFDWPEGRFDCVVLSETGFYLSRPQLRRMLQRIDMTTTRSFVLVLCHWTGEICDWPLDAAEVHEICLSFWPQRRIEAHADGDYLLDILTVVKPERSDESGAE